MSSEPDSSLVRYRRALLALAVAAVTFACFSPALFHGWVDNWDDNHNFINNRAYRGLGLDNIEWAFTTYHHGPYQPLSWISLGLDYELWGMSAQGYHLTNNLLHALTAVVVFFVGVRVLRLVVARGSQPLNETRLSWAAAAGALVFSIHPLRVESVAWVTERRDVLSGLFFALTLLSYLRYRDSGSTRRQRRVAYAQAVGCFFAAMLAKATGMALPVALLVLDAYLLERVRFHGWRPRADRTVWLDKLPLLAITVWIAYMALQGQQQEAAYVEADRYGLLPRLFQCAYGLCFYVYKTLVPIGLSPLYEGLAEPGETRFLLAMLGAAGVTIVLLWQRRRCPGLLASWLFYAIVASPILGLVKVGAHLAADRYTYLPCLPWAALAAYGVYRGRLHSLVPIAVLGVLAVLTFRQTRLWRDSETLWEHAVACDPQSDVSRMLLGMAYYKHDELDRAEEQLLESVRLGRTDDEIPLAALGHIYYRKRDFDDAITWSTRSLQINPGYRPARQVLQRSMAAKRR